MRSSIFAREWLLAWVLALLGLTVVVSPAVAQDRGEDPQDEGSLTAEEGQQAEAEETEPGDDDRRQERGELKRALRLQRLMRKQLELRDEQVRRINKLFEEHFESLREQARVAAEVRGDNAARIRELERQLADARRDGNKEAMGEAVRELRELRGGERRAWALHRQFRSAVLEELDAEQGATFRKLFRKVMRPRGDVGELRREVQVIQRALHSLDLTAEQQEATRKHSAGLRDVLAKVRQGDQEAAGNAVAELRRAVIGELTQEQVSRFEAAEVEAREHLAKRPDRPPRRSPRDMPRRPREIDQEQPEDEEPPPEGEPVEEADVEVEAPEVEEAAGEEED